VDTLAELWRRYLRPALPTLVAIYVPLGAALVAVKILVPGHHASALVHPSWSPGQQSLEDGSLWVVGIIGWGAAAVIALAGWAAARHRADRAPRRRLLLSAALLSGVLLADDLWQLHKPTIPDATGVPAIVVLGAYAALTMGLLWTNRRAIAQTDVAILVVALAFFALWLVAKVGPSTHQTTVIESGAKLCGIAGWVAYVARVALGLPRVAGGRNDDPSTRRRRSPAVADAA
jgi:hypothetical protein